MPRPSRTAKRSPLPVSPADFGAGALLICALIAAYLPALNGGMLWDDSGHVTAVPLQPFHGLYRIWFELGATQQYYPLLHSAFWLEHRLWGDAVAGYHLTNLTLHAISAFLIVAIMRRLSLPGAWFAAFLFALHPVGAESVAWISEQKNTLSTVLYLGSTLVYLGFDRARRRPLYLLALSLYAMAILSKSVTATLPVTLLVVMWWQRGRLSWRRDVTPLLPWFGIGAAGGALTAWVEHSYIGANGANFDLNLVERCLLACRALCFYAANLVWPIDLTFIYPRWTIEAGALWQYVFPALVLAIASACWIYARQSDSPAHRAPLAALLCFAATLAPALGFVNVYPFLFSYVADHFQYQASIAIFMAFAAGTTLLAKNCLPHPARLAPAIAVLIAATLGLLTWRQSHIYSDEETLYRQTIARNPDCWMAYDNLGLLTGSHTGQEGEAIRLTRKAVAIRPDIGQSWNNLADLLARTGQTAEAIADFRKAISLAPALESAHDGLASALLATPGGLNEAIAEYRTAIRLRPDYARPHFGLAGALLQTPGHQAEAIREYRAAADLDGHTSGTMMALAAALGQAGGSLEEQVALYRDSIRLHPESAEAHLNLGATLLKTPNGEAQAIAEYREAIRLNPHYAEAHYNLGSALSDAPEHMQEAIAEYEAALREKPNYAEAHCNLGIALADIPGRVPEAIEHFKAALRAKPDLAEAEYAWGMALGELPGKSAEAIAHFKAALRAQPDFQPAREVLNKLHITP